MKGKDALLGGLRDSAKELFWGQGWIKSCGSPGAQHFVETLFLIYVPETSKTTIHSCLVGSPLGWRPRTIAAVAPFKPGPVWGCWEHV